MVAIIIVTHREVAEELLGIVKNIYGNEACANIAAVSVVQTPLTGKARVDPKLTAILERYPNEAEYLDKEIFPKIEQAANAFINNGYNVVVLSDIFGATPCNLAVKLLGLHPGKVDVVTGVSLPMLCALIKENPSELGAAVECAMTAGMWGIKKCERPLSSPAAGAPKHVLESV